MAEEKILIIEDDYETAVMIDNLLSDRGYRSVVAYDGLSGLDLALQEQPDLILLDLRLPQMSGAELLSKLQERQNRAPVVVMTAMGSEKLAVHALRMGAKDYINKPFSVPELLNVIERALEQGRLRFENAQLLDNLRESRDRVAERSAELKTILSKLVRLQRIALSLGALTAGADLEDICRRLTEYAASLLEVKHSAILLYAPKLQELVCQEPAYGITAEVTHSYRIALTPDSPIWNAWQRGQSLIANDLVDSPLAHALGLGQQLAQAGVRTAMFCALRLGDRSIGLLQVSDKLEGGGFTPDDLRILEILASQGAIAIENARLFAREKRRVQQMETLVQIAQAVSAAVNEHPQALLERVARGASEMLRADAAVVLPFINGGTDSYDLSNVASSGLLNPLALNPKVTERDPVNILRFQNPLLCEDIVRDRPDLVQYPVFRQQSARAFVGVLLEADEIELGVLYVIFHSPRDFEEQELNSLRLMAHQAALAIAKSRLFQTLNRHRLKTNAGLRRNLQTMEELQKIGALISSTPGTDEVFDRILHGAMSISGAPNAALLMTDEQRSAIIAHVRHNGKTVVERIDRLGAAPSFSKVKEERSTLVQDGRTPWLSIYRKLVPDTRSFLYVPIGCGSPEEQIGLLGIGSPEPRKFGPDDLRLLETLASQAAIAIQKARFGQTARLSREQPEAVDMPPGERQQP